MIWDRKTLPSGRVYAECRLCHEPGEHMNDRAADMWARKHDPVECGRRGRIEKAAQASTTAPLSHERPQDAHGHHQTQTAPQSAA